jgi:hypothetical protein
LYHIGAENARGKWIYDNAGGFQEKQFAERKKDLLHSFFAWANLPKAGGFSCAGSQNISGDARCG